MKYFLCFLVVTSLYAAYTDAVECENGWRAYKDEQCIKVFPDFFTYEEAKYFCASQGNSVARSTMAMLKDSDVQAFLVDVIDGVYEHMWLGAKYDQNSASFLWEDGNPVAYTNWADGYTRNITDPDVCIQLKPKNSKAADSLEGKWEDAACQRRNLAICQREAIWGLSDAVREIISLRKTLETTSNDLQETQEKLDVTSRNLEETKHTLEATKTDLEITKGHLEEVNSRVVPVGSIYIEYFNQPSPVVLWPTLGWQDVTVSYAGLFFRALGENSEQWGNIQPGCAPRLHQVQYLYGTTDGTGTVTLPESDWSLQLSAGAFSPGFQSFEKLRFNTQTCEVRPRNQAVKIWKRLT